MAFLQGMDGVPEEVVSDSFRREHFRTSVGSMVLNTIVAHL